MKRSFSSGCKRRPLVVVNDAPKHVEGTIYPIDAFANQLEEYAQLYEDAGRLDIAIRTDALVQDLRDMAGTVAAWVNNEEGTNGS